MQAVLASPTEYMRSRKGFLNTVEGYSKLSHRHKRKQEETKVENIIQFLFKMPKSQGHKKPHSLPKSERYSKKYFSVSFNM